MSWPSWPAPSTCGRPTKSLIASSEGRDAIKPSFHPASTLPRQKRLFRQIPGRCPSPKLLPGACLEPSQPLTWNFNFGTPSLFFNRTITSFRSEQSDLILAGITFFCDNLEDPILADIVCLCFRIRLRRSGLTLAARPFQVYQQAPVIVERGSTDCHDCPRCELSPNSLCWSLVETAHALALTPHKSLQQAPSHLQWPRTKMGS